MMYRKSYNIKKGIILADILLALALGALFATIIAQASFGSRQIFERAHAKSQALDAYEALRSGLPMSASTTVNVMQGPFGNDMSQSVWRIDDALELATLAPKNGSDLSENIGTPFCSVELSHRVEVGSYGFFHSDLATHIPTITAIMLPVNPLLPLTDLEVRNGIAYVSDDSSTASDPDMFVIDIHDKKNARVLSSLNTGPGISAFALAGERIYAAAASTASQLHIIRLDSLDSMSLETKYQLPEPPPPLATATLPMAESISYSKGIAYLGTEKWDGDEVSAIDVRDPLHPNKISGLEISSKVNDIYVSDGHAYISSAAQNQLQSASVSDVSHPAVDSFISPSGWSRQEGKLASSFEGSVLFGRTSGGFNIASDPEAFVWVSTSTHAPTSLFDQPRALDIPGGVYGILADRSRIYIATRQIDKEIQIYDRTLSTSTVASYPLPVAPQAMACDGDHIYILAATAPVIYEISFY